MRSRVVLIAVVFLAAQILPAQVTSDFTLTVHPTLDIPLGPEVQPGVPMYAPVGGGVSIKGEYTMPFARWLYAGLVLDTDWLPTNQFTAALTSLGIGPEVGVQFFPVQRLGVRVAGYGGAYLGMVTAGSSWGGFAAGLLDVSYLLNPSLSIGAGVRYKADFGSGAPVLYQGLGVTLGVRWHVGAGTGKATLQVVPQMAPVFPLFYSFYDKNPAGTVKIRNGAQGPIENVVVGFFVKQFMDQPKICWQSPELARGGEAEVPLYALFNTSIFDVTEGTKAAGEITVSYRYLGSDGTATYPVTVTVNNRNAMSWDDTNKAAAFVTAKDPTLLAFAKKAASDAKSLAKPPAMNATFRSAVALFQTMDVQGIGYSPDPASSYVSLSENTTAIDYLQFPLQTFTYRGGDCDDLSILYAALLEAVGIRTAFVTTPGHIFLAFDAEMKPAEARGVFSNAADLIFRNDETWVPVEITRVRDGFLRAWKDGALEWRSGSSSGTADFYPVRDAWKTYEPVSSSAVLRTPPTTPEPQAVFQAFSAEFSRVLKAELDPRVTALKQSIAADTTNAKLLNRLGVLYARFGMYTEAGQQFEAIAALGQDIPVATLVNLGNISYLGERYEEALGYFRTAIQRAPESAPALLGLLLSAYEMGDRQTVDVALTALKKIDPPTAEKYQHMGSGGAGSGRAASAEREVSLWGDEE